MNKIFISVISVIAAVISGCGKDLPECSSELAQKLLRNAYYEKYNLNENIVKISFQMTSTEAVNKELGFRECRTQVTVGYSDEVWRKIQENQELIKSNPWFELVANGYRQQGKNFGREKSSNIQYKVKTDEKTKENFISYNAYWLIETDLSYEIWKESDSSKDKHSRMRDENKKGNHPIESSDNSKSEDERREHLFKEIVKAEKENNSYADRVRMKLLPLIIFKPSLDVGNPAVEVGVELASDGTILARKVLKSSGVKEWDRVVLKAIDDAQTLPKDEDGRVPKQIRLTFRPKD